MSIFRRFLSSLVGPMFAEETIGAIRRIGAEFRLAHTHRQGCRQSRRFFDRDPLLLHVGCGEIYKQGWINIDTYHQPPCRPDLLLDLRRPLPFLDDSCAEVYSEHVFEHLPFPGAAAEFLRESWRVLAPGGRICVAVPDPRPVLEAYLADIPCPYFEYFFQHPTVSRHLHTRMEAVNWLFRQGGEHQFIYDFTSLREMLVRTGFDRVEQRGFDPARDSEVRRWGTIYVDAFKPA